MTGKTNALAIISLNQFPIADDPGKTFPSRTIGPVMRDITMDISD